jgi:glycosyltransferase involved in cell wall biosynthesis
MGWHVISSTYFDFGRFAKESEEDRLPHHLLPPLADRLGAEIHQPADRAGPVSLTDRALGLVYGEPPHWALARRVLPRLRPGDTVYAAGDDGGFPLALLCGLLRRRVGFAVNVIDVSRLRTRVMGRLLMLLGVRLGIIVATELQAGAAARSFGRRAERIDIIDGQTDTHFFRPATEPAHNVPPLVASAGVERRDYVTLARAMEGLEAQALVCFASPNRNARTRYTRPDPVPGNMELRYLPFDELRDLYQRADVVALPLLENRYSAGLTTLFEAIACGTPVVVTDSAGLIHNLIELDLVIGVAPGDHQAMRAAIQVVLDDPASAGVRARKARELLLDRYSAAAFLDRLEDIVGDLAQTGRAVH